MKYKGIIFDLDGVIVSTDMYQYKAWKQLADKLGIYFDEEINNRLRGVSRMASLDIILERSEVEYSEDEKVAFATEKNDNYRELLQQMTTADLSDEVKSTLDKLRDLGLKLAIGSSSKNAPLILERIGLGDYFDAISDGNNITHSKPHPEVFLIAAERIGLEPAECLVIEDAEAGVDAAKNGNMDSAGINAAKDYEVANYHLDSFAEILDVVQD